MKVRYIGRGKIEYNGTQYHPGDILTYNDELDDRFEYVKEHKKNIELQKLKQMVQKLDKEIKDLTAYRDEYKKRSENYGI